MPGATARKLKREGVVVIPVKEFVRDVVESVISTSGERDEPSND